MAAPKFWDMLYPIYNADRNMHVIIKEWGKPGSYIWEGSIKDIPFLPFEKHNYTVARIEARIEEDMHEVQYYSVEVVELR